MERFIPDINTLSAADSDVEESPQTLSITIQSNGHITEDKLQDMHIEDLMTYTAKMIPQSRDHKKYVESPKNERNGLINRSVFMSASLDDAHGHRIYGSRFVHYVNNDGTPSPCSSSRGSTMIRIC